MPVITNNTTHRLLIPKGCPDGKCLKLAPGESKSVTTINGAVKKAMAADLVSVKKG